MFQESVCAACKKSGTNILSRCGHILHLECLYRGSCCPKCGTVPGSQIAEAILVKIKQSKWYLEDAEEAFICSEKIIFYNPERYSSIYYDEKILALLQKFGWDINNKSHGGVNLFYRACIIDDLDKVNLLVDHGLDLAKYGEKGVELACENSSFDVLDRFIKYGLQLNNEIIFTLIESNSFGMLRYILKHGVDINFCIEKEKRPIHQAAQLGSIKMIQFLTENGADFNALNIDGNSIVHYTCFFNDNVNVIVYLMESGFDFSIQSKEDMTPLLYAISKKHLSVANFLIKNKQSINVCDDDGNTPLHYATLEGNLELIKALLDQDADINAKNYGGSTPLHYTDKNINDVVRLLLDNGAEMNILDNDGKSPLYYFHKTIDNELKKRFIEGGADLSIKNQDGRSILELMLNIRV